MPSFKDDSILIIAPGSRTTLAQLGLPESFTPARSRFRSRMFPADKSGEWEPHKVRRKHKQPTNGEVTMGEAEEDEYEEDRTSNEGAVWPIEAGRVTNWECFFALMEHVHRQISPPFHTPILVIAQPIWTPREHEKVTQFFFEKFRCPGFALVDSAVASLYAYGSETATIVDIGAEKADVTAVTGFVAHAIGRSTAVPGCGGEAMTQQLLDLLQKKGFTRAMCEQLKMSPICEVLPAGTPIPGSQPTADEKPEEQHPLQAASTGASGPGADARPQPHTNPAGDTNGNGNGSTDEQAPEDDEGVLDVASIVTGGKMNEYLAKKEKEKADKLAARKKGGASAAEPPKPVRLKNSEKEKAHFHYEDHALHDALKGSDQSAASIAQQTAALDEAPPQSATSTIAPQLEPTSPVAGGHVNNTHTNAPRRTLTVGPERFQPLSPSFLLTLTSAIHHTIQSCPDIPARSALWSNIIILGAGSSVRGLKDAILETLIARYLIHPSSATMFTSELPSNFSTPLATGTNTPVPGQQQRPPHGLAHAGPGGGVNPLLHAATTAAAASGGRGPHGQFLPQQHHQQFPPHQQHPQHLQHQQHHLQVPGSASGQLTPAQHQHQQQQRSHLISQTPTSIALAKLPEYFLEWKEIGHEEAMFLGAQVVARCLFVVPPGGEKGYLSRSEYNESGPQGVQEVMMGTATFEGRA